MLYTVTFNLKKEEVYAIAATLDPKMEEIEVLASSTPLVTEWIRTTTKRRIQDLVEKKDAD